MRLLILALLVLPACTLRYRGSVETTPELVVKKKHDLLVAIGGKGKAEKDSTEWDNEKSFGQTAAAVSAGVAGYQLLEGTRSNDAVTMAGQRASTKQLGITAKKEIALGRQEMSFKKAQLHAP